jgi:hypothetical protein
LNHLSKIHPDAHKLFDQWQVWLKLPLEYLVSNLLSKLPEAREMRQVSPFSGMLGAKQRTHILKQFRKDNKF